MKCPVCNGCLSKFLINDGMHYFCEFCREVYKLKDGKLVNVSNEELGGES